MPHVLIVEDDPLTVRALLRLLASRGADRVTHAATVAQALVLLDPAPDWIILDMNLAGETGLAVLEAIRQAELPSRVIVSSATTDPALLDAFAAYEPEFDLTKPFNPALLPIGMEGAG